ncbi:MAG: hypothetical protein M0Q13_14590 [Methanothrix sp.]|jgi:hypothetical protein|nr:hypothetical protein [Methanothrix sp.]
MDHNTPPKIIKNIAIANAWLWLSVFVSILVTITSLSGIFLEKTYFRETEAWAVQAIGQDYANLAVVILLLVSTYYVSKNSLRAYLVWLGAYIYLIYAFAIYAFSVHFNSLFLIYIIILGVSFYTLVGGLTAVDATSLSTYFLTNTKSKIVSALLMIIGILFGLLWLSEIVPSILSNKIPPSLVETGLWVNPVHVLDLAMILPGMIITSVLLWRRNMLGFLLAVPLMVFSVTMGAGIISMFIISAIKGMPSSLPAGMIIGLIMLLSMYFSYLFLREVKESN